MPEFAADCPISRPTRMPVKADVDLNGIKFSYRLGFMYEPQDDYTPLTPPPPHPVPGA